MTLKDKAKTPMEIEEMVKEHMETFRRGAMGNHAAYNKARDTRRLIEEDKWIRLKDHQQEIQELNARWSKRINNKNDKIRLLKKKLADLEKEYQELEI